MEMKQPYYRNTLHSFIINVKHERPSETLEGSHHKVVKQDQIFHALLKHPALICI
jgi:hypothetical protein